MPITKTNNVKDGKRQYRVRVNYVDALGNYRQKERRVYGMSEARAAEAEMLHEKDQPIYKQLTLQQLYTEYIETKSHEVRESSLMKTQQRLRAHVLKYLGDCKLSKLTRPVLQNWKNTIAKTDLAINTKRDIYAGFRAMLNYAVKMDYVSKNSLVVVGNFKEVLFETPAQKIQYYTADEFVKFASELKRSAKTLNDWGFYTFFCIAFYTGMRKGEINALRWSDIDSDVIHVRRSVNQKLRGEDVYTPPKNRSSYRDLQMPKPLQTVLAEHKERQQRCCPEWSHDLLVCGGIKPLRDSSIDKVNRRCAAAAGLHRIRIHDFRHSHASLLANAGINIQEVARRLGHSKVETTWNTYAHLYPREEERALVVLNDIFI